MLNHGFLADGIMEGFNLFFLYISLFLNSVNELPLQ